MASDARRYPGHAKRGAAAIASVQETVSRSIVETKSEQLKPFDLHSLMKRAKEIATELPVSDASSELSEAIHRVIEILDDLEGDPDFECNGDHEHDPADMGELEEDGFQNEKPWDEFCDLSFMKGGS